MKTALVLGGGGFIGTNLVERLKLLGYWVRAVDLHRSEFSTNQADEFIVGDLRDERTVESSMCSPSQLQLGNKANSFDEVYQLAADMGGMGFLSTGENDSEIMHNSALINIHVANYAVTYKVKKIFYSSSACIYPKGIQDDINATNLKESYAWPADPESPYGVEKIFSEVLYDAFLRNHGLAVRIARFHNVFGEQTKYDGIRAKAPAAICRKVAQADEGGTIEIWGDGEQTRSFLYVSEAVDGILRLMDSECTIPVNIGSDELISINDLTKMVCEISGKKTLFIKHIDGPQGVRGRNSDNTLIKEKLGWAPSAKLYDGMKKLYQWVEQEVKQKKEIAW